MPRTLDPALAAAMNSGVFTPYFKVQLLEDDKSTVVFETEELTGFELNGLTAKVQFHDSAYITGFSCFRILRGALISGVPNYVTSSCYWVNFDRHEKRIRILEGHLFPVIYLTTNGAHTYKYLCDRLCADFALTAVYADAGAAWLNYQFYPAGRQLTMSNAQQFFTILRQKYLVYATDDDNDRVLFYQAVATAPAYPAGFTNVNPGLAAIPGIGSYKTKSFLSRDENMTTHTSGDPSSPMHNLGYLESTAAHPDRTFYYDTNEWVIKNIAPNLKYLDFDALKVNFDISTLQLWPARVREVFDKKLTPSWQWQARFLDIFANTEGGAIPSTLEASAPYTPLNTSTFDKNLNSGTNNLQALAEKVDELDCGPVIYGAVDKPVPDDADLFPLVDSDTVTHVVHHLSWAELKTDFQAINDSLYQSLATKERELLVAAGRHYHVRTDGNDANTGLVDSAGGAFLTIQHAVDVVASLDTGIYDVAIEVGNGTYNESVCLKQCIGAGTITIHGNSGTPANVIVNCTNNAKCFWGLPGVNTIYVLDGFKLTSAGTGYGISADSSNIIQFKNVSFGTGFTYQIYAALGGYILATGAYSIVANGSYHVSIQGGRVSLWGQTVTLTGTPAFTTFADVRELGWFYFGGATFSGGASAGTKKYYVYLNSVAISGGVTLPGGVAGTTATGGQYS
jgi:hypothetical protein